MKKGGNKGIGIWGPFTRRKILVMEENHCCCVYLARRFWVEEEEEEEEESVEVKTRQMFKRVFQNPGSDPSRKSEINKAIILIWVWSF